MRQLRAVPASSVTHLLAEGPVWDAVRARLLWVDIERGEVWEGRLEGDRIEATTHRRYGQTVGAVVCAEDGRLLIAAHDELVHADADGTARARRRIVHDERDRRCNDGACDPAGRFLIGTMALDDRTGQEQLYRLEPDGQLAVLDDDLTVSNGLAWSPDGATLYSVDSEPGVVWARSYDVATGQVGVRREVVRIEDATPDGMCSDAEGNLWIAMFGGGEVRCHAPSGEQLATVAIGVPDPTSVAFVGPSLDRLLVTTSRHELDEDDQDEHPDAGRLFLADVGVRGNPVALWDGRGFET